MAKVLSEVNGGAFAGLMNKEQVDELYDDLVDVCEGEQIGIIVQAITRLLDTVISGFSPEVRKELAQVLCEFLWRSK